MIQSAESGIHLDRGFGDGWEEDTVQPAPGRIAPTLLYVEDDSAPALLFKTILHSAHPTTRLYIVGNPDEALAYLHKQPPYESVPSPDLLVIDLHLGVRSGLDLLESLRSLTEFGALPAVVFSSSRSAQEHERARALGALEFIRKPMELSDFERCVEQIHSFAI